MELLYSALLCFVPGILIFVISNIRTYKYIQVQKSESNSYQSMQLAIEARILDSMVLEAKQKQKKMRICPCCGAPVSENSNCEYCGVYYGE